MGLTWGTGAHAARSATHAAIFAPLAPLGRAEAVAQRLADAIHLGLLEQGERLPTEQDLGRQFGVATVTAREALESLRAAGLIETRRGRAGGSFVCGSGDDARAVLISRLAMLSRVELRDMGLVYGVIAGAAAERAALFATADEVRSLGTLVEDGAVSSGAAARRAENGIRIEVAALSRSARLVAEQVRLQSEFGPLLWIALQEHGVVTGNAARHRRLVEAIGNESPEEARGIVTEQVGWLLDRLLAIREGIER
ncbi:FadR/GntR family transcriptional regulator [Demequina mangrovi]|uniref:Transcriptional regulator, GntR family n=1 Tax=Demequina mangrovi TaxID=1043493 RepID=A0A1H6ZYA6_9MICO|nr:GntR family transcriptional regulator [Demequina mangrovi]SEJ57164.1 transcriptional regulator, GntR family [Demequina mangrovi]